MPSVTRHHHDSITVLHQSHKKFFRLATLWPTNHNHLADMTISVRTNCRPLNAQPSSLLALGLLRFTFGHLQTVSISSGTSTTPSSSTTIAFSHVHGRWLCGTASNTLFSPLVEFAFSTKKPHDSPSHQLEAQVLTPEYFGH